MKKILLFFVLALSYYSVLAIFSIPEKKYATMLINSKLLITLKVNDDNFNRMVKEIFPTNWTFENKGIEFKTEEEISKMSKQDLQNYGIISSGWVNYSSKIDDVILYSFSLFIVDKDAKPTKNKSVFFINIIDVAFRPITESVSDVDIVFACQQFNNHLNASLKGAKDYRSVFKFEENQKILKQNTLLLEKEIMKIEEKDIPEVYPYTYKVVSGSEIKNQISSKNNSIAYYKLVWSDTKNMLLWIVVNNSDGKILAVLGTGGIRINVGSKLNKEGWYETATGQSVYNSKANEIEIIYNLYQSKIVIKEAQLKYINSKSQNINL